MRAPVRVELKAVNKSFEARLVFHRLLELREALIYAPKRLSLIGIESSPRRLFVIKGGKK